MLKAILIAIIIFELLYYIFPIALAVFFIGVAILIEFWWIPFTLLLISHILKKL